jgi:hypothetical protein
MKSGIFGLFNGVQCESLQNGLIVARSDGGLKTLWTRDGKYYGGDAGGERVAPAVAAFIKAHS